ncbi:hypothetical protein D3P07_25080 [Paenibacillus sp. 1011MAR3C5]|nr:hypothetical protein D3P07_25080 [Paenibacillus sp. 1011MAR3C5]
MNEVDELNGKIADAEKTGEEELPEEPTPSEPGDSVNNPDSSEQPAETTNPSESQQPPARGTNQPDNNSGVTLGNTGTSPEATPKPTSPGGNGGTKPTTTPPTDNKDKKKKEIDAATTTGMEKLRASCTATSNNLVNQIVKQLKADEDATAESIQGDFLTDIMAAEAKCDVQFNALIGQAKAQYEAAGLDEQSLPDWGSEYESAKSQARSSALTAIASAMR